ncbi:hypothetical protein KC19_3G061600 [Ceratodon purpureus]|uniref:Secreted protein n=1 Tax=Ceratodon purpureus TaxID=3225 RepID=A0A8T0IHR4_CERPU|nr:hypothetical protein KC19_3G061600 [Ceratodon purpureus]
MFFVVLWKLGFGWWFRGVNVCDRIGSGCLHCISLQKFYLVPSNFCEGCSRFSSVLRRTRCFDYAS